MPQETYMSLYSPVPYTSSKQHGKDGRDIIQKEKKKSDCKVRRFDMGERKGMEV